MQQGLEFRLGNIKTLVVSLGVPLQIENGSARAVNVNDSICTRYKYIRKRHTTVDFNSNKCMHTFLYFTLSYSQHVNCTAEWKYTRRCNLMAFQMPCIAWCVLTRFLYLNFLTRYNNMSSRRSCWTLAIGNNGNTYGYSIYFATVGFRYPSSVRFEVKYEMYKMICI